MNKDVFVNNGDQCYFRPQSSQITSIICEELICEELFSKHKEADQKVVSHAQFESERGYNVCVVADDSDIFILLLSVAQSFQSYVYFRQGKSSDKDGIVYNEVNSLADHLGENVCTVLPAFHVLTGSDYTSTFFGKTKLTCFKRMISRPETCQLLGSLSTPHANIDEVSEFVLRVIYNRPRKEKTLGDARYNMLFLKGKGKNKKYASTKALPPDANSLSLKVQRDNYVTMGYVNCMNPYYVPPPATSYAWEEHDNLLYPVWTVGPPIPDIAQTPERTTISENRDIIESIQEETDENDIDTDIKEEDEEDDSDNPQSDDEDFEEDSYACCD